MERSCFTLDLGAIRRNAATLLARRTVPSCGPSSRRTATGTAPSTSRRPRSTRARRRSASRRSRRRSTSRAALRNARILVMGPVSEREIGEARVARLELVVADGRVPEGVPVHLKLDTGMGRWGLSELPTPTRDVVGVMSHLASAESDPAFTQLQIERFREATARSRDAHAPPREQRGDAALRRGALRRRALRYRALRDLAVRRRSRPTTGSSPPSLGVVRRARQEARARGEHGLRTPLRRRPADVDRHRAGRVRGRLPTRHDGHGGARRRRPTASRRDDLDGRARRRARRAEFRSGLRSRSLGDGVLVEEHARSPGRSRTRSRPA